MDSCNATCNRDSLDPVVRGLRPGVLFSQSALSGLINNEESDRNACHKYVLKGQLEYIEAEYIDYINVVNLNVGSNINVKSV